MCDVIRHRGPDDDGFHVDRILSGGSCAIGMRRLSIIDLHTGHQPISNEDDTIWIVFNGEIYEFGELRRWLIDRGHRFRTNTDTECILHLYEEAGVEGLHRLRGMFAFCIWDSRRQRLLLARDRFGKKPLYYAVRPEGFYFGSEIKCLAPPVYRWSRIPKRSGCISSSPAYPIHGALSKEFENWNPVVGSSSTHRAL